MATFYLTKGFNAFLFNKSSYSNASIYDCKNIKICIEYKSHVFYFYKIN